MTQNDEKIHLVDNRPDATERANFTGSYDAGIIKSAISAAKKHGIDPYTFLAMGLQESNLGDSPGLSKANPFHAWDADTKNVDIDADISLIVKDDPKYMDAALTASSKSTLEFDKLQDLHDQFQACNAKGDVRGCNILRNKIDKQRQLYQNVRNIWRKKQDVLEAYMKKQKEKRQAIRQQRLNDALGVRDKNINAAAKFLKEKIAYAKKVFGNNIDEDLQLQAYNGFGWMPAGQQYYGENRRLHGKRDRPYGKRIISLRENVFKNNPMIVNMVNGTASE